MSTYTQVCHLVYCLKVVFAARIDPSCQYRCDFSGYLYVCLMNLDTGLLPRVYTFSSARIYARVNANIDAILLAFVRVFDRSVHGLCTARVCTFFMLPVYTRVYQRIYASLMPVYTRVYQRIYASLMPVYTRFYSRNNPNTRVFMATTRYEKPVYQVRILKQMDNHSLGV